MSLITDLLTITSAALAAAPGVREERVAAEWAERHGKIGDDPAVIRSWSWTTSKLAWLRLVQIDGGSRTQVVSILGTPHDVFDLPLLGAEVVCISGSVMLLALDWMPLFPSPPYLAGLSAIRRQFDHFPAEGELPPWAAESFSSAALFSRPRGAVPDSDIRQAFTAYLEGYLSLCDQASAHGTPSQTRAAQRRYCLTHADHDPGSAMLARMFGEAWAADYARTFLFRTGDSSPSPRQPEQG